MTLDFTRWRRRAPWIDLKGYHRIAFYEDRVVYHALVHRVVLEAFVGPCPTGQECCHRDSDPANNQLTNLRWDTPHANSQDKRLNGTYPAEDSHPSRKLSRDEVARIKTLYLSAWLGVGDLARLFGVTLTHIRNITSGRAWPTVQGEVLCG